MKEEEQTKKINAAYMLRCADGTFYCGWTNDLDKRLKTHNAGKGARYTRGRRPVSLGYWEYFCSREEAMRREAAMKKLTRKEKELLVQNFKPQTGTSSYSDRSCRP